MSNERAASGNEELNLMPCERGCSARHCDPECWSCYIQRSRSFVLKIDLVPRFLSDGRLSWVLVCPARATFADLHLALQVMFGWTNSYPYTFAVFEHDNNRAREDGVLASELGFTITPVPVDEAVVGTIPSRRIRDSSQVKVYHVFNEPMPKGWTVQYSNEFGRGRKHDISCIERRDPAADFFCLNGKGVGWDKNRVNQVFSELSTSQYRDRPEIKATVLLISLYKWRTFDDTYADTIAKLSAKAVVTEVTHLFSAIYHLSNYKGPYNAVVVTDPTVIETEFLELRRYLVNYTRAGGTAVLGLNFYTAGRTRMMDFLESGFGFSWESDLFTSSVRLNSSSTLFCYRTLKPTLPHTYEVFARVLINVPFNYRVFTTAAVSRVDTGNATAVFAKFGEGYLGYIGDEKPTVASMELLLTMCGV